MKILSIETTSNMGSVALLEEDERISEFSFNGPEISGRLVSVTDLLLKENHIDIEDVDRIVVSRGPGSWTGIRMGIAFAKGLAIGIKEKIYSVETAESIFFGIKELKIPAFCIVNAYRERVHLYSFNGRFYYRRGYPTKTLSFEELYRMCIYKKILLVGPGITVIPPKIKRLKTVTILQKEFSFPSAGKNALLAIEKIERKIPSPPPEPFYG